MTRMARLLLAAFAMTLFLVAMIADHQFRRHIGTEVLLDLEPVDPRDLLAGYYVVITTPLHNLDPSGLEGDNQFDPGDDIFVALEPVADQSWRAVSIHRERPQDGLYVYGKVRYARDTTLRARFNLERYYADEATAQALEDRRRANRSSMRLIIAVGDDGSALIRGLEIDGERHLDRLN
ncbi:GDYXXLXY domain-containing protein [Hyphobacterium sp.]|uniref:GDYXXLXY domain-containing protein n=1 Tax=Hyphobacterium sp. TaxID=2004662 RepID=UPI003749AF69